MSRVAKTLSVLAMLLGVACGGEDQAERLPMTTDGEAPATSEAKRATFGAGCFWCVEAVFQEVRGVSAVTSGYMGGAMEDPSYEAVCSGTTGHAEVAQLTYDPAEVTYESLLEVFWKSHDPTTLNRQGGDTGTQYRSVVFYHDDEQRRLAVSLKERLDASGAYPAPLVTEIVPAEMFYAAGADHQDYFTRNAGAPYCRAVIAPKLDKFRKVFGSLRK